MIPGADRIIVALDVPGAKEALSRVEALRGTGAKFKIGLELFCSEGPPIVEKIQKHGDVFLDLKLHDIPETAARAAAALARLGVWMFNVHASAGEEALRRVVERVNETADKNKSRRPLLIAVTVLTSLADLEHLGSTVDAKMLAASLAKMALAHGFDGVVCSPREVAPVKANNPACLCVTPGIRRPEDPADDQARTAAPAEAVALGSDYLVIGRPITRAPDPAAEIAKIAATLAMPHSR